MTGRFLYWKHTVLWGPPELLYITQARFRPFSSISCKQRRFHLWCMCDRASHMKMTRGTNLMQQLWFIIINYLYMFRASICPSSGVLVVCSTYTTLPYSINNEWWQVVQKFQKNKAHSNAKIYSDFHVHIPGGVRDYISDLSEASTSLKHTSHWATDACIPTEIGVRCLPQRGDSLLHLQTYKSLASQVVRKGGITGCQIDAIHEAVCILPAVEP
jgi:hypothetical protein